MSKDEIKLQSVQQPIKIDERKETIAGVGYTQRPLKAKTQTDMREPIYCIVSSNKTVATGTTYSSIDQNVVRLQNGYTEEEWTPEFASHGVIRIPADGLYIITAKLYLGSNARTSNPTIGRKIEEYGGATWFEVQLSGNGTYAQEKILTFTEYFTTGQKLMPKIFQTNGNNSSAISEIRAIKLS